MIDVPFSLSNRDARMLSYEKSVDYDMVKNPDIVHIAFFNKLQGSGKDLLLNAELYSMYFFGESLFHICIDGVLNRPDYKRKVKNIYANCNLNKDVYGSDFTRINTMSDIESAVDGILYLSDAEKWFNSRGETMTKPSPKLIDLCNNTRKSGLVMLISTHRYMSNDVKLRTLFPLWIFTEMYCLLADIHKLNSYSILYKIRDSNGKVLMNDLLSGLPRYANLFDTTEKTVALR